MRQKVFEAVIETQNRHIERLERMVEQLFNALQQRPAIDLGTDVSVGRSEPEKDNIMAGAFINEV